MKLIGPLSVTKCNINLFWNNVTLSQERYIIFVIYSMLQTCNIYRLYRFNIVSLLLKFMLHKILFILHIKFRCHIWIYSRDKKICDKASTMWQIFSNASLLLKHSVTTWHSSHYSSHFGWFQTLLKNSKKGGTIQSKNLPIQKNFLTENRRWKI